MNIKNKKVLATGLCGFIGNALGPQLIKSGAQDLVIIDRMDFMSDRSFYDKNDIPVLKKDICDESVSAFISEYKPDIIIHMAADSHVDRSITNPDDFVKSNVFGTVNLLNASIRMESSPLFVGISTDEVYGDNPFGWSKEGDARKASSPYSASKASAELFIESYGRTYNLPYLITRSSNNYGPFQHSEKFIPKVISNILSVDKIPIYGNGMQERDWIYVDDNASAIMSIINSGVINDVFNIGGLETLTNIQIVNEICNLMNVDPLDYIEFVKDRPGHDKRYAISIEKIEQFCGWKPTTKLTDGLVKTIEWNKYNLCLP